MLITNTQRVVNGGAETGCPRAGYRHIAFHSLVGYQEVTEGRKKLRGIEPHPAPVFPTAGRLRCHSTLTPSGGMLDSCSQSRGLVSSPSYRSACGSSVFPQPLGWHALRAGVWLSGGFIVVVSCRRVVAPVAPVPNCPSVMMMMMFIGT
jgi:hypothetical protein